MFIFVDLTSIQNLPNTIQIRFGLKEATPIPEEEWPQTAFYISPTKSQDRGLYDIEKCRCDSGTVKGIDAEL